MSKFQAASDGDNATTSPRSAPTPEPQWSPCRSPDPSSPDDARNVLIAKDAEIAELRSIIKDLKRRVGSLENELLFKQDQRADFDHELSGIEESVREHEAKDLAEKNELENRIRDLNKKLEEANKEIKVCYVLLKLLKMYFLSHLFLFFAKNVI